MIGHLVARSRARRVPGGAYGYCDTCGCLLRQYRKFLTCEPCQASANEAQEQAALALEQARIRSPRLHVASCYLPPKGSIAWSLLGRVVEAL